MDSARTDILVFDEKLIEERDYWIVSLSREIAASSVPPDRPRPNARAQKRASAELNVTGDTCQKLSKLVGDGPFLLLTTLMAALKICLRRYGGENPIVVGTPALSVDDAMQQANALAIIDDVDDSLSFRQFLLNVRQTLLDAYARQLYPFALIVKDLGLSSDAMRCPLFDVALALKEIHSDLPDFNNDITITFARSADQISGVVTYSEELFEPKTIERFARHFLNILRAGLEDTTAPIGDLELLDDAERHQIVVEWNRTQADYETDRLVQDLIEAQAEKNPSALAVVFQNERLTYAELNARANQLARYLKEIRVGPESLVGICVGRSVDMVVAMLAALKAGGAYLPLDPSYPKQRIEFMLKDARARALVTERKLYDALPVRDVTAVCLDADWEIIARNADANLDGYLAAEATIDNLAYVIYTSGSTGLPKGVEVSHRGLMNLIAWHNRSYGVSATDRASQVAALGFDASVWEIWPYLAAGARVHLADDETRMSASKLLDWLNDEHITVSFLPTPTAEAILASHSARELKVRALLTGGDKLRRRPDESFAPRLINHYGPTENAVITTCAEVLCLRKQTTAPSIGRPIANTQVYILDRNLRPAPVGIAGELHIAGESLARGYLRRPEITAERFIPNPFSNQPGSRMYRTGDTARYLPDGDIDFLGRNDQQIKIRGYRIEPGEIEAALQQHGPVREAAVIAREDAAGQKRLIAYVVADTQRDFDIADARSFLKERLPDYMIPSAFVVMDALPLTPHGKLDKDALPEPSIAGPNEAENFIAARTPVEEVVAGIWADVLRVERISINEDFFALGGNSLLATQAVSRITSALQVALPLQSLFETPTVTGIAERIESEIRGDAVAVFPPIERVERAGRLPLSFAQQRLWFLDQLEPQSPLYNIPAAIRLAGELDSSALERAIGEIVRRHESLRTRFSVVDGQPAQIIEAAESIRLPIVDLAEMTKAERESQAQRLAIEEAKRPFDLSQSPMIRATLLRLDEREHIALLTIHHIAGDGWSVGVIFREVAALYEAFLKGEPSPLPELAIQYVDYAVWQRRWLEGATLEYQLSYWKDRLAAAPPVLEMPVDRPRPKSQTFNGAALSVELPKALSDEVAALSRREGVTLFMTLLASFQILLQRYTGQDDVLVGAAVANRRRAEFEDLIGFFVNTLVMRTDLSGDPSFRELLGRARDVALGAYAHQDAPFEMLVEQLQPERSLSHSPLFQVMLVLQNAPVGSLHLTGLTLSLIEPSSGTAKFDLLLSLQESERGLRGLIEYNTDLFDCATIERLLAHFENLLGAAVSSPEKRISALAMLTEAERQQLIVEWNDTTAEFPRDLCVHRLFEQQVERAPEKIAVIFDGDRLAYQELNARANQVARYLKKLGAGPGVVVGICVERSLELAVGLLGILKSGAAYLPLDTAYPNERLAFMLEDARAPLLVTQTRAQQLLPEHNARVVCLDADWQLIAGESLDNPETELAVDNLAYVIYTSGSTGRPKGVCLPHRALTNLIAWHRKTLLTEAKLLQFASLSFDASFYEFFCAWSSGGTIYEIPEQLRPDPQGLARFILSNGIEKAVLPVVVLQQIAEYHCRKRQDFSCLKEIITTGEQLQITNSIIDFFNDLPGCSLHNHYGPSESHVVTAYPLGSNPRGWAAHPPIGRPIPNTQIYLLDRRMNAAPVGVPGELYIGGVCLARGYLDRPDLTAEKFVPDPFAQAPGSRLYRTGDLARYLSDANIEYIGRIDHQVKIRGFRVELGEIEATLGQRPAVREAVVVAREDRPGQKQIVAYVVGETRSLFAAELMAFLRQRLPAYMIPSAFVMLERFPLNPNGKIDRRALPAPEKSRDLARETFAPPRTQVEEMLAAIFGEVLGLAETGIHDNFFDLGGHSLLATQLISRAREAFKIELPLRALFESPTVATLAESVEAELRAGHRLLPEIQRLSPDQEKPLSFAQQRLWFLDQLEPNSPFYNIAGALRLSGRFDVAALERSLAEIARRHESLRTTFVTIEGRPAQVIAPDAAITLPVIDLSELSILSEREATRLATAEARRPFDLARGPLLRATVTRLKEAEHILLLTMHHIISDGWSMGVLVREIAALYEAFSEGRPSPLPDLAIQYSDFASWQRRWLQGEALEAQLSYWKNSLAGELSILELPLDHPRPPVPTFRGATEEFDLPAELSLALNSLSRAQGVTLFMTLLAGFKTLLHRYTGQDEIIIGCDIANRNHAALEGLIGFFVNMLVMRADFSGDPDFQLLLARARETSLGAYAHQDLPFEQLVEALQPDRDLSRNPLFQVNFVLQNAPMQRLEIPGLTIAPVHTEVAITRFDMTLSMTETERGLSGAIVYSTDLFDAATIKRMTGHLEILLRAVTADARQRVSHLPLLTEAERDQLLSDWNSPVEQYPPPLSIHQLFEAQVERTPDAVAVAFEDQRLTYRELNERANQLAHHLQGLGIEPESLVGICVDRSVEMIVGLLGILKAGGAYLPLDPEYPKDRLATILEATLAPVVLTQRSLVERMPLSWARVICLDAEWERIAAESASNPDSLIDPANLAYVIYTSGSTGKPKGAMLHHAGVCHRLLWGVRDYNLGHGDKVLNKTVLSFDVSVWEIFAPLVCGAQLVVALPGGQQDSAYLVKLISEQKVTHVDFVPSMLRVFLEDRGLEACDSLKRVTAAGEALTIDLQRRFFSRLDAELYNLYGPTEASLAVTYWSCNHIDDRRVVPIGARMSHARIYLLDRRFNPTPVGVAGELYIGGIAVGRGYLDRPELTAENFLPDPFAASPGARLYRTGDLARYLPDGSIEFLGRIDHQVKIRGFRVELGEIEATLGQRPAVREAVVVAREDRPGDRRLVAYFVATEGAAPGASELQSYLKERLPEYMLPSAFVMLDAVPLTLNGKVDRRALPAPDLATIERGPLVAPRNAIEEVLAAIWSDVLDFERASVNDNFFDLGGHSLLATQAIGRAREAFRIDLPLRALFTSPTIAELAAQVEAAIKGGQSLQAPPIKPAARDKTLPLSFAQQRLWLIDQLEPGSIAYNVPSAVRLKGRLDVSALERTLNEVVRRHEVLRTTFAIIDGQPAQVINQAERVPIHFNDLSAMPEIERESQAARLAAEEAQQPFGLAKGPMLRARLLKMADEDHIALFTMHHIVSDGWSIGVFVREIAALYEAFLKGEPSPLSELAIQYADFAAWQRDWLQGDALENQLSYWKRQLAAAAPMIELATDRPRPPVQTSRGARQGMALSSELSQRIKNLSRSENTTLFMTLLAAFQTLLHRYTGQDDILVGSPIANRSGAEIENLIGFFANTLALRTDLSGDPRFIELLGRVRAMSLEAYAHQDLPFEKLVEELRLERDISRAPLFQVMFVLQNATKETLALQGLSLSLIDSSSDTAKFDLTLAMMETEDGLIGSMEYNTDLFDASTIARMLERFEILLEAAAADPTLRLSELPLLTRVEEAQMLSEWNARASYPRDVCLHRLFEEQAKRAPDSTALVSEKKRLSYRELNRRANQLAHHLRKFGVGPESLVGLCAERSIEMVVALLAILKAGAAYVPLDPSYPRERLAFVLEDAGIDLLLTQDRLAQTLPAGSARVVYLERDWKQIALESSDNPSTEVSAENLAYVIYTSGSTGKPKGVPVTHANVARLMAATESLFHFGPQDVWTLFHSYAFDFSVWEIWGALSYGGKLVIVPYYVSRSPQAFYELMRGQQVSVLNQTPSAFRHLIEIDESQSEPLSLRLVIFGGEALELHSLQSWFDRHGDERPQLINMYGITETTVHVTYRPLTKADAQRSGSLIGRALDDLQIHILDERLRLAPIGVAGEMCVGGAGLARGYLNRPDLTAEQFIPDPFAGEAGARLYKTGDRARWLDGGDIEYLGRIDHQVKIRGYRIEPGEIETALAAHPAVRECVALARDDGSGNRKLLAFIVAAPGAEASAAQLRNHLKERLPEYMIPSSFVTLERLPLTPSGKLDRKALPNPESLRPEVEADYVAPITKLEKTIAAIWRETLGVERVGIHDNFFDLGGHSLLVVKAHGKLREALRQDLAVIDMFKHPTVSALAKYLSRKQGADATMQRSFNRAETRKELIKRQRQSKRGNPSANR